MRRIADSVLPLVLRQAEIRALFLIRVVANLGSDITILVEHGDTALQFREHGVVPPKVDGRRQAKVLLAHLHEIPIEVPVFDTIIGAVADAEERLLEPRIKGDAMTRVESAFGFTRTAECLDELAVLD